MKSNFLYPAFLMLPLAVPFQHGFAHEPGKAQEPSSAAAETMPLLHLPIDCVVGENCWVQNYVDTDPSERAADFTCSSRTYDGHKGTDIAIRDKATMDKGVAVLAALDGRVLRTRDGEPDRFATAEDMAAARQARRECGNAAIIDHGNGLQTLYCHMKKGSVKVRPEQQVKAGEKIGEVGLSGVTEFPHVHLSVLRDGASIDPFTGLKNTEGCGRTQQVLWHPSANMHYQRTAIWAGGFYEETPQMRDVSEGVAATTVFSTRTPVMAFWMAVMGPKKDDILRATITAPDGKVFVSDEHVMPKDRARQFHLTAFSALLHKGMDLKPGIYAGKAEVIRAGQVVQTLEATATVSASLVP